MNDAHNPIHKAELLRSEGRLDEAMRIADEILNEKIDDPEAMFLVGNCLIDGGKVGLANVVYTRFLQLKPNVSQGWNNLGRALCDMQQYDRAERCFRKAVKLDPEDSTAHSNIGLTLVNKADPNESIRYSKKAIELNPNALRAKHNLAIAQLMVGKWDEGWDNYEASVGALRDRNERCYNNEPRWDGEKGKHVIAYGEQGIGDEISFASMIPDLVKDCEKTYVECDSRLEGLFKRSFPDAEVHGTRYSQIVDWNTHDIEARVSFGSLGKFYRKEEKDCPGTPYLVADPQRRLQWRALLDSLGPKPKIGISWRGGLVKTGRNFRSITLEDMLPILRQNATFVSLQYLPQKDEIGDFEEKYGISLNHWDRAAEARNYEETAALVAELDLVISVTTAVIHLSGSLGVPCWVLVPTCPQWRYGLKGERIPWYNSVHIVRQEKDSWLEPIHEVAFKLRNWINGDYKLRIVG